jgi:hypothetical protein
VDVAIAIETRPQAVAKASRLVATGFCKFVVVVVPSGRSSFSTTFSERTSFSRVEYWWDWPFGLLAREAATDRTAGDGIHDSTLTKRYATKRKTAIKILVMTMMVKT